MIRKNRHARPNGSESDSDRRLICVGAISGPFGTGGEARIISYCEQPEAIARYSPLISADGQRTFNLQITRRSGKGLIARLSGVIDREQVAALKGTKLFADRASFPTPDENEYYRDDLIGLEVRNADGSPVGRVLNVLNHGAGDLLEVSTAGSETLLIPFTRQAAPEVCLRDGLIIVDQNEF